MKLRVLIADDELLSRERLRQLLQSEPGIEIVAECASGKEALAAIRKELPDLVFLDVRMPDLDGLGVIKALSGTPSPAIIFVTGYDQFALQAFEVRAVDYLLKPFTRDRFQTALGRARKRLQRDSGTQNVSLLSDLLASLKARHSPLERITIKSGDRIKLVMVAEIDWICAADNYVELHVGKTSHLLRITITALADQLPQKQFLRIRRSVLVNLERIKEIRSKSHGDSLVILHDGTPLAVSRTYRHNLARLVGNLP
jgi:two-component system LytT family response regulator